MKKSIPRAQSFMAKVDRALHNLYQEKKTTMHPMLAIPIYYRRMFKGDVFNFGVVESILQSEPTFAPLLANWKLRFEWYFDSDANRYGWIDNNTRLTAQEVMNRVHHRYATTKWVARGDEVTSSNVIGRGGIADYAGIAPGFQFTDTSDQEENPNNAQFIGDFGSIFNVDFHLTYLNIIRNYHVNKQFPNIPYISNGENDYSFDTYSLSDLDELFVALRSAPNGVRFNPDDDSNDMPTELDEYYYGPLQKFGQYLKASENRLGGLFCTQFEPDLYANLLAKDQNLLRASVTVSDNGITIEEFRLANHLQGLYDKIFVSGGTDRELSRTIWGIESNRDYDIPELLAVHSEIIGTNLVQSSTAGSVDIGTNENPEIIKNVAGSFQGNVNSRRGAGRIQKFTAKTSGSLMLIVSLTPLVDYSQNIERHLLENNFMDEFTPDMARKGFEDVPITDYCALPTLNYTVSNSVYNTTIGKLSDKVGTQIAWLREMTAVNRVHGELSNYGDKQDWILRREYMKLNDNHSTADITPYGNPLDYQYPFVTQTLKDPNFVLQVAVMCKAYRPVPRRFMPNLGN